MIEFIEHSLKHHCSLNQSFLRQIACLVVEVSVLGDGCMSGLEGLPRPRLRSLLATNESFEFIL